MSVLYKHVCGWGGGGGGGGGGEQTMVMWPYITHSLPLLLNQVLSANKRVSTSANFTARK